MSYYPFQKESMKWWGKLFFNLFALAGVHTQILHGKKSNEEIWLHPFGKGVANILCSFDMQHLCCYTCIHLGMTSHPM
jgi:hypothetical protein